MFWKRSHDVIHVEYFDAESGKKIGQVKLPIERLPEGFEADTTLHRDDQDFRVERAEPMTAAEFRKTGKLRLVLRRVRIEKVNPRELLYSLPTVSNEWPPI